jgi:hypothetical protein
LVVAAILVPPALSYGINPAAVLPKTMTIAVEGTDQTEMLRAIMGHYLGMTTFCVIAAFTPAWRHIAVIWAVFFLYSIALGRILSLIVDGVPIRLLLLYLAASCSVARWGSSCSRWSGASSRLGDDVGQQLVLDAGDLVLEEQLLFLEPLQLELIGAAGFLQRVNGAVEIAMLLLEFEQRRPELANVLALHGRPSSSLCLSGTREIIRANARLRKRSSMEVCCLARGPEAGRGDAPTRERH